MTTQKGKTEKTRKAFVNAFVKWDGHLNHEFQEAKNREASEAVLNRNAKAVKIAAIEFDEEITEELKALEKKIQELKAIQHYIESYKIVNPGRIHTASTYGMTDRLPEIEKMQKKYEDKYFNKKYGGN